MDIKNGVDPLSGPPVKLINGRGRLGQSKQSTGENHSQNRFNADYYVSGRKNLDNHSSSSSVREMNEIPRYGVGNLRGMSGAGSNHYND